MTRHNADSSQLGELLPLNTSVANVEELPSIGWKEGNAPVQAPPAPAPRSPRTLSETGISQGHLNDLLLKTLYVHGVLQGNDLARMTRLPSVIVEDSLRKLREQMLLEISLADVFGRIGNRYELTEIGYARAKEAVEACRYVGPAPVSLQQYIEHCQLQRVTGTVCNPAALRAAFNDYVMRPSMLSELGPAICSGKSILLYGPPGNGKTVISKGLGRFLSLFCGEIYVPYAIMAENCIITLFDPGVHQTTDDDDLAQRGMSSSAESPRQSLHHGPVDLRWRRIKRPVVITGSELTLDLFELKYNKMANFYNAPLHIKANGGVFLVDDLGRQAIRTSDLLNRWSVPLEEGVDYLTLVTGRKCVLPLEQLTIFATNLHPREIADSAFLRRIKYKLPINPPSRELFSVIFHQACRQRDIPYDETIVDFLFQNYYELGRVPRASDPRDLLEIARSICRFSEIPVELSEELIDECARRFFEAT
jgi:predicted ATPase with chaperone activity